LPLNRFLEPLPDDANPGPGLTPIIHKAIFDPRYAECSEFARAIGEFDVPAVGIADGDPTEVWFNELDLVWRESPVAIAGLTQFGPLFALQCLAQERGMRVALRIEHHAGDNRIAHRVFGGAEQIATAEGLAVDGISWPTWAAVVSAHCREVPRNPLSRTLFTEGQKPTLRYGANIRPETIIHYYLTSAIQKGDEIPFDGPLVSWVLAPYARPVARHETT
jgi:hypothetical protein